MRPGLSVVWLEGGLGMGDRGAGISVGEGELCPWQYSIGPHPLGHGLRSGS